MVIIRSVKPYHYVYKILQDLKVIPAPATIKEYDDIDWTRISGHTTLLRMNLMIQELGSEEYVYVVDQKSEKLSDAKIKDLGLVFWTLAKIQSDPDLMEELTNEY